MIIHEIASRYDNKDHAVSVTRNAVCSWSKIVWATLFLFAVPAVSTGSDAENCFMCHKMPGLGIEIKSNNEKPRKRLFYISKRLYKASSHGNVSCKGCHQDVNEIPHGDIKKVNCASDCHIRDPSTDGRFSHVGITNDFVVSVHGNTKHKNLVSDYPTCKYCHSNMVGKVAYSDTYSEMDFINVCTQCHGSKKWLDRLFKHVNYRTSKRRTTTQVIELCSRCHADPRMMEAYGLNVVTGFADNYHSRTIRFGNSDVANCLNCHGPYETGYSPHRIMKKSNSRSSVSRNNLVLTCGQSRCHRDTKDLVDSNVKIHPSSLTPAKMASRKANLRSIYGSPNKEFQYFVLSVIRLFYKFVIGLVVCLIAFHQILELLAHRRERKLQED